MSAVKVLSLTGLFVASLSSSLYASDIPCDVIGTRNDPNLIKLIENGPGSSTPEETVLSLKDQYNDAIRCKNRADAKRLKMYYEGIQDAIDRDNKKKNAATTVANNEVKIDSTNNSSISASTSVPKKISIQCVDESVRPKVTFDILGTDTNGAVVAEGFKDQMLVRLMFDNKKPELGRTIEVVANNETNKLSLHPGLGPIGFKPGFAMRMVLKAMGVSSDIKINCMPLTQKEIVEPSLEATPTKIVDDSSRDRKKASDMFPETKQDSEHGKAEDVNSTISK